MSWANVEIDSQMKHAARAFFWLQALQECRDVQIRRIAVEVDFYLVEEEGGN
jgi:K+-sensing histidine kinase KdpD